MGQQADRGNRLSAFAGQLGGKLGVAVSIVGFVVIFLGWNGAASFNDLRQQFPYLISGGIAGLALVGVGAALLVIESARAERAELQSSIEDLRRAIESLGAASGSGQAGPASVTAGQAGPASVTAGPAGAHLVVVGSASFHRPECRLVAGRDQMAMVGSDEAEAQGLAPCRICRPSEQGALS